MPTCSCEGPVPIISESLAIEWLPKVPFELRKAALDAAFAWLTMKHATLSIYQGIMGRPYTAMERNKIASENTRAARLPCPFMTESGCLLGGLPESYTQGQERLRAQVGLFNLHPGSVGGYALLPMFVAREWGRRQFAYLLRTRQIADGKVAYLTRNEGLLEQPRQSGIHQFVSNVASKIAPASVLRHLVNNVHHEREIPNRMDLERREMEMES